MIEQRGDREYRRDQPTFHGYDRQQLRSAPHAETRAAFRPHRHSPSSYRSGWTARCARGSSGSRRVGEAIRSSGLRGVPGLRLQGKDATSAHQHAARLEPG
jgi:hypothetical protein